MDPEIARAEWGVTGSDGEQCGFPTGIEKKMKYLHVFGTGEEMGMLLVASDDNVYGIGYSGRWILLGAVHRNGIVEEDMLIYKLSHQRVIRISVGEKVGAAITADGKIFHWGRDLKAPYEVDEGDDYDDEDDDHDDADASGVHQPGGSHVYHFVDVVCGAMFVAALTNGGQVILWGLIDERAQVKYGTAFPVSQIKALSCGMYHIAMLSTCGDVFTCGYGSNGQLGREWSRKERYLTPKPVTLDHHGCTRVVQVACGFESTLFLMEDGSLFAAGASDDDDGHLGVQTDEVDDGVVRSPERVVINQRVKRIAATNWNPSIFAAVTECGNIFTWGEEEYPWKVKNETKLISAFYGAAIPPHLGDIIQPIQQRQCGTIQPHPRLCGTCGQTWPSNS